MTVYIAGPMTGIKYFNFPAFDYAGVVIRAAGYTPVNPAQLDRQAGFDAMTLPENFDWYSTPPRFDMAACIKRDIDALLKCDAIYLLDGWQQSKGARAEHAIAVWINLLIISF